MASLRKKPADVAPAAVPDPPAVAIETNAAPSPTPELAQDDAAEALRRQLEALHQSENLVKQQQIAMQAAKERRDAWVESNPLANQNLPALNFLHQAALNAGLADTSPEYFNFMEEQLAALQRPAAVANNLADEMQQRVAQQRVSEPPPRPARSNGSIVSAPVSREAPNALGKRQNGKITLTPQEVEMAKLSNITLEEYAAQKLRLQHLRDTGQYSEDRR